MKQLIKASLLVALAGYSLMWLTSYSHYTSIGINLDQYKQKKISHSYYRLRWPGNGSIWLGGGYSYRTLNSLKPFERIDLAATFLYSDPELPEVKSYYNKIGFWLISTNKSSRQFWIGIPSWLPVLFLTFLIISIMKRLK